MTAAKMSKGQAPRVPNLVAPRRPPKRWGESPSSPDLFFSTLIYQLSTFSRWGETPSSPNLLSKNKKFYPDLPGFSRIYSDLCPDLPGQPHRNWQAPSTLDPRPSTLDPRPSTPALRPFLPRASPSSFLPLPLRGTFAAREAAKGLHVAKATFKSWATLGKNGSSICPARSRTKARKGRASGSERVIGFGERWCPGNRGAWSIIFNFLF